MRPISDIDFLLALNSDHVFSKTIFGLWLTTLTMDLRPGIAGIYWMKKVMFPTMRTEDSFRCQKVIVIIAIAGSTSLRELNKCLTKGACGSHWNLMDAHKSERIMEFHWKRIRETQQGVSGYCHPWVRRLPY